MSENTHSRLDRIEDKLNQLTEAMVALARTEEKLAGLKEDQAKAFERLNRFSQKLDEIEMKVVENNRTVSAINKMFWLIVVASSGAISANIWM